MTGSTDAAEGWVQVTGEGRKRGGIEDYRWFALPVKGGAHEEGSRLRNQTGQDWAWGAQAHRTGDFAPLCNMGG